LEEDVPCTQVNVVHYYVDLEDEDHIQDEDTCYIEASFDTSEGYFSRFLRLLQKVMKTRENASEVRVDYSTSYILTSTQHVEIVVAIVKRKRLTLEKVYRRKKEKELTKLKKNEEKVLLQASKLKNQAKRAAPKAFKA